MKMSTIDELSSGISFEKYYVEQEIIRLLQNWDTTKNKINNFIRSYPEGNEKKRRANEIYQRLDEIRNRLFFYYSPGLELCKKLQDMKIVQASRHLIDFLNSVQHYMGELNKIR